MGSSRRIAHLDMDAFFASVELLRYPELRGRAGGAGISASDTIMVRNKVEVAKYAFRDTGKHQH